MIGITGYDFWIYTFVIFLMGTVLGVAFLYEKILKQKGWLK